MLISFHNLVDYGGENLRAKIFVHGESVFNSGQIHKIGTLPNAASSNVRVHAVCKQSSHVKDNPFVIDGEITLEGKIQPFRCTCGAGTKCKHILASLLHCLYFELPRFSCTDLNCSWNKIKTQALANYQPMPVYQHSCFSKNSPEADIRLKDYIKNNFTINRPVLADILPAAINSDNNVVNVSQNVTGNLVPASLPVESLPCESDCDEIESSNPNLSDSTQNSRNMADELGDDDDVPGLGEFCKQVFSTNLPKSMLTKHDLKRHTPVQLPVFTKVNEHEKKMYLEIFQNQDCKLMEMLKLFKVDPLQECCQNFLKNLAKNVLEICVNSRNYFAEWLNERKYLVTGTKAYPLYTYCKKQRKPDEWESKCQQFIEPASFSNDATEYGIKNESKAREIFKNDHPYLEVIETGLVKCPTIEWLGASPDGVIYKDKKPFALLEIKCFTKGKTLNADAVAEDQVGKCLEKRKSDGAIVLKHNHKYYGQVQLGMAMLNVDLAYFVIHSSFEKKNYVLEVPKDLPFLNLMLPALKKTYYSVLLPEMCRRGSENPDNSCHKEGKHFIFEALKDASKKSKSKSVTETTKNKAVLIAKDPTKNKKKRPSGDEANMESKKKNLRLV